MGGLANNHWLVLWNMNYIFHFIYGIILPIHIFKMVKTTNQLYMSLKRFSGCLILLDRLIHRCRKNQIGREPWVGYAAGCFFKIQLQYKVFHILMLNWLLLRSQKKNRIPGIPKIPKVVGSSYFQIFPLKHYHHHLGIYIYIYIYIY